MSNYNHINNLLKKYPANYKNKYEVLNPESEKRFRQIKEHNKRLQILHTISKELKLNTYEKEQVTYILSKFPNIKKLHGTANTETIICALCFNIKHQNNPGEYKKLNRYRACNKYDLNQDVLYVVVVILLRYYRQNLTPYLENTNKYDHDLLSRHNGL